MKAFKRPPSTSIKDRDWDKLSMRSGTSVKELKRSFRKHDNVTGPGQYDSHGFFGRNLNLSHTRNSPRTGLRELTRSYNILNPENRNIIPSKHMTPAPS